MDWQKWRYIFAGLILLHVEVCWSQYSVITLQPSVPTVGGTVSLLVNYNDIIYNVNWYRGDGTNPRINIASYSPNSSYPAVYGPMYTGREKLLESGTLQISNLMANYSGIYTLELTDARGVRTWNIELNVQPPSGNGNISSTSPPEMNKGVVAGIAVGVIAASGLVITGVVIWMKRCCGSSTEPIYEKENPKTAKPTMNNDTAWKHDQPAQRLPSLPPRNFLNNHVVSLNNLRFCKTAVNLLINVDKSSRSSIKILS
ncbi:carcinoembryonic antigen-related cell adhesion molecule 3 [Spea bombifrons]|uniref:carcinoembryonic antigen-related cell adhesion molecule 3 n=1 Tax=Spea bombifrons TaxID=233779 RepID=UPI002349A472|nr:carcinoembryonic antigen-related cell adhesion molecule 3 [Spea bombifrons]